MSLKELLKASHQKRVGGGLVLPHLNTFLNSLDDPKRKRRYPQWIRNLRPKPDRRDQRFHPSSLGSDFCARSWVIKNYPDALKLEIESESVDVALRRIFEMGDNVHCMMQYWFAEAGWLYGRWVCSMHDDHQEWGVSCVFCKSCGAPLIYAEVPIDHAESNILGHCDGELWIPDVGRIGIEVKSTQPYTYKAVSRYPLSDHRVQGASYLKVRRLKKSGRMKHLGEPKFPKGMEKLDAVSILYYNKENSQIKEHVIRMNDELRQDVLVPLEEEMDVARLFDPKNPKKTLPPRTCKTHAEGKRRKCNFTDTCFNQLPPLTNIQRKK